MSKSLSVIAAPLSATGRRRLIFSREAPTAMVAATVASWDPTVVIGTSAKLSDGADAALLDMYDLHEVLGRGAYGIVRRATSKDASGLEVAVKSIRLIPADTFGEFELNPSLLDERVLELRRECELMREVEHDNHIRLHHTFEPLCRAEDRLIHLVLDLCRGIDLFEVIKQRGALREAEGRHIMKQLLSVCAYHRCPCPPTRTRATGSVSPGAGTVPLFPALYRAKP